MNSKNNDFMINTCLNAGFCEASIAPFSAFQHQLKDTKNAADIPYGAKSVIVVLIPYYSEFSKGQNISSYAVGKDYHRVAKENLKKIIKIFKDKFPNHHFVGFCDNSPFHEVHLASYAGLGKVGKNNMLIHEQYGSFVFIAEIVTDLVLCFDKDLTQQCENCKKCIGACPNGALNEDEFHKEKCLSFITQKKGELSSEQIKAMKKAGFIWGCDICLRACPHNKDLSPSGLGKDLIYQLSLHDIENLTEKEFSEKYKEKAFIWRGKKVLERNIKITMGG